MVGGKRPLRVLPQSLEAFIAGSLLGSSYLMDGRRGEYNASEQCEQTSVESVGRRPVGGWAGRVNVVRNVLVV